MLIGLNWLSSSLLNYKTLFFFHRQTSTKGCLVQEWKANVSDSGFRVNLQEGWPWRAFSDHFEFNLAQFVKIRCSDRVDLSNLQLRGHHPQNLDRNRHEMWEEVNIILKCVAIWWWQKELWPFCSASIVYPLPRKKKF